MTEEVLADAEAAARRGAELIAAAAAGSIAERGSFSFAVSGGSGPWRMFELLDEHPIDWRSVEVFQVDERIAPDGDPDRNLTQLVTSLPDPALERVRPMPVTAATSSSRRGSTPPSCPTRSTSSTSASAPTATPPRSFPATRCSRSPTGVSRPPGSTRGGAG